MTESSSPGRGLGVEVKATLHLAWPLAVAQLAMMGQGVIEALLAGHIGARVLAGVAIGASLVVIPMMGTIVLMYAVPPIVARLEASGRRREIGAVFVQALWLGISVGLAMLALVRWAAPLAVALAEIPHPLADDVHGFLDAVSWALPAVGIFMACRGLSDGLSLPAPTMVLTLIGLVLLVPVGYVLMGGGAGIPPLGAAGAGYAAAFIDWLGVIVFLGWLRLSGNYEDIGLRPAPRRPDRAVLVDFLRVGGPMAVAFILQIALFSFATMSLGRYGELVVGAHQIALNVALLGTMVSMGIANAATIRVSIAAGKEDGTAVRHAGLASILLAFGFAAIWAALLAAFPRGIAALYTHEAALVGGAIPLVVIAGLLQFPDGLQAACNGALRGLGDFAGPMALAAFGYWIVGAPLGFILAVELDGRASGMWAGLLAGVAVSALLLLVRFRRRLPSFARRRDA